MNTNTSSTDQTPTLDELVDFLASIKPSTESLRRFAACAGSQPNPHAATRQEQVI